MAEIRSQFSKIRISAQYNLNYNHNNTLSLCGWTTVKIVLVCGGRSVLRVCQSLQLRMTNLQEEKAFNSSSVHGVKAITHTQSFLARILEEIVLEIHNNELKFYTAVQGDFSYYLLILK